MGNARVQVVRKADPEPDAGCNAPTSTEEASAAGSIGDASRYTLAAYWLIATRNRATNQSLSVMSTKTPASSSSLSDSFIALSLMTSAECSVSFA